MIILNFRVPETFGEKFRALRKASGKTMGELARHLSVSVAFISAVERDKGARLAREQILAAADFMDIPPNDFLSLLDCYDE